MLGYFSEKAMAPHSIAWKIPWTEEPGRLWSMRSRRVGHDWATSLSFFTFTHWRRKWQPVPVFLPGESQGQGAWWAAVYGVAQSRKQLKWLKSRLFLHVLVTSYNDIGLYVNSLTSSYRNIFNYFVLYTSTSLTCPNAPSCQTSFRRVTPWKVQKKSALEKIR